MRRPEPLLLAALAGLLFSLPVRAQAPALTDSLRLDPNVRTGVLPNGMRYFIKRNGRPEARVSLRLAVAAGSTVEADDQQGIAHFTEHMNFNGSKHFKDADDLVAYLQMIGMRFGADVNAYTSFDETVYMLEVPTDRDSLLDRGLNALSDFAGRATMSDQEIDKERGVVLEEWRLGRGAQERIQRKQFPLFFKGSRYADRIPIGKPEILRKVPAARLRDYYRDWYTPNRMAVVAVGDIDPARMDSLIRVHFGDIAARPDAKPTPTFEVPRHPETLVNVATDKEATGSQVGMYFKHAQRQRATVADFRRGLAEALFSSMLNARFDEITHRANAPFLNAGAYGAPFGKTLEFYTLNADVADGGIEKGLEALLEEVARVRQHGFLENELARAKDRIAAQNERAYAERDKSESGGFASQYVSTFLSGNVAPGIEATYQMTKALLPGITLSDVTGRIPRLMHTDNRLVLAEAPEKKAAKVPTEAALRAVLAKAADAQVAAWVDTTAGKPLMATLPTPGTVTGRRVIDELGVTVLTLSNGVEVWLKPTDFKADEIVFSAVARGGLSVADSADFVTAFMANIVVNDAGVGGFTSTDLQKMLSGRIVRLTAAYGPYQHGLNGGTRPVDLETTLQLVHLGFGDVTEEPESFAALQSRLAAFFADRANSPEQVFQDTLSAVNTGRFYMSQLPSGAQVAAVKLKPVLDFHRRNFANAADFTFYFAGAFHVDSIAPLLARYIGSLPSTGKPASAFVARGPRYPSGIVRKTVRKGVEPKASTRITFFTHEPAIEELDMHRARAAATILNDHLRETLRELLSGSYGASASFANQAPLPGYSTMTVAFGCAPENVEKMIAATLAEVKKLRDAGPSAADVQKDQEVERRELEVGMKQNGTWTGSLQTMNLFGWDPRRIAKRRERIDLLTPENLKESFRKYFPLDHYSILTLLPETGAAGKAASPAGKPGGQ
ncbi:MAG TPA: insulinase family protein [Candidatus Eisenbacteria bacterium]|nr:insulinase family protein [Candidatus Eisenbacteria bacterium]